VNRPVAVPVTPILPTAVRFLCPACGARLPLWRRVRAARLRCPAPGCNAAVDIRGRRVCSR